MSGLKFTNVSFSYDGNSIFKNFNFCLRKDKNLSIIGPSGSGKTTLLRLLNNEYEYDGKITIDDIVLNEDNYDILKNVISVVFRSSNFLCETVKEELTYILSKNKVSNIKERLNEINDYFNIKDIFNKKISDLSVNDRTLVKILSYAITFPKYLAVDDLFVYLNTRTEILLLNYLNSKNILLINVTSDLEDCLYTDYTMCLYNGISAIDGKTLDVLNNEKILKRLGLSLPFMIDLSIQLKDYGVIDKEYLSKEAMVKGIWK